jgi:ubiquinone/menaquinone biosynthesis C-methylase UbiE
VPITRRLALIAAAFTVSALTLVAQQPGVHPVSGRVYARTMGVEGAGWLERRERENEENPDLALRLLRIRKGATVADIGAGSGYMTIRLARIVGPTGKVYASDIQAGMLTLIQQNVARAKLDNVAPVLGAIDDPKLPADSIDLAIMVDVYHEFSEPQKMLQRIREALKPDGRLVLLEYRAEDPAVPILADHKMTKAQVKQELEHEGFKQSRVYDDLPWQHLFVFTKS